MSDAQPAFEGLIQSLKIQAAVCGRMGSAFSQAILDAAAGDIEAGGPTRGLMDRWAATSTRAAVSDAVPLRLLGALHDRALGGDDGALAAAYPTDTSSGDPRAAWTAALAAMSTDPERLSRFMDHEPQTNEVRRSACLLPGFLALASATGLPMRIFELGASAGLNQLWDRYAYELGDVGAWGDPDSPVRVPTDWRGAPPALEARIEVVERAACDRKPVDLTDAAARRRLRAYVWADQRDRLQRLDAAIAVALAAGTSVEAADAVHWTRRRVAPRAGAVTVLFHSVFWQYMPPESQTALAQAIEEIGAMASPSAPFAWLRMEPAPNDMASMQLRLSLWPSGSDTHLATVHPHGAWVEWLGA
jgi:hypothetical protein